MSLESASSEPEGSLNPDAVLDRFEVHREQNSLDIYVDDDQAWKLQTKTSTRPYQNFSSM